MGTDVTGTELALAGMVGSFVNSITEVVPVLQQPTERLSFDVICEMTSQDSNGEHNGRNMFACTLKVKL